MVAFYSFDVCHGECLADLPDFTQLVEKNAPAVVNVQATTMGMRCTAG